MMGFASLYPSYEHCSGAGGGGGRREYKRRSIRVIALAMTENMVSRSRDMFCPRYASSFALLEIRGRREDRVLAAPTVPCAICADKKCTRAYRAAGASRPSLRNGFTAYFVLFPENGSFASVVGGRLSLPADLMPAPRHQNHTTSPYAPGAYVSRHPRPSHLTARS
jgi:hypothetical protein